MLKTGRLRARVIAGAVAMAVGTATMVTSTATASPAPPDWGEWVDEQVEFILSKQLDDGAILGVTRAGYIDINPYFSNIAALGLIAADTPESRSGALAWMEWYFDHLNSAAPNVPAHSVFDYRYYPDSETTVSVGDMDSVDSYASTALEVAHAAYLSGDPDLQAFVVQNITTYEAIANILNYGPPTGVRIDQGQAGAGLTIAKPSYPIAYTMDNAEVYRGLAVFAELQAVLGRPSEAAYYEAWADTTSQAVSDHLWNPANGNWDWAYLNTSDLSNPANFYAQGTAQLWPVLFDTVDTADSRSVSVWSQFTTTWPDWNQNAVPDAYPWTSLARVAQLMGDWDDAAEHLEDIRARFAPANFTYPTSCGATSCGMWYVAEAGWFILAAMAEAERSSAPEPSAPAWSASEVYLEGDTVSYGDSLWVAQWWTRDQPPGSAWAEVGAWVETPQGAAQAWTPSWIYTGGESVAHNGSLWEATWWTRNQEPGASPWGPWRSVPSGS